MRNMDHSLDEYHSANDESFCLNNNNNSSFSNNHMVSPTLTSGVTATTTNNNISSARKQLTAHNSNIENKMTEPPKPLSPYALFFKDTVSTIKQQNPTCQFQEISRIVASMWEVLDEERKNVYNQSHETAKRDYINQMHLFRQQQLQRANSEENAVIATAYQSKPAVFTISRSNSNEKTTGTATADVSQGSVTNNPTVNMPAAPDMDGQNTEVNGKLTLCTRENCNKVAIVNPDWEDEYCSNECVIIHCRNVFNAWVQSNLEARAQ